MCIACCQVHKRAQLREREEYVRKIEELQVRFTFLGILSRPNASAVDTPDRRCMLCELAPATAEVAGR